jgi:two-component system, OmpR family, phosphate regulon sensor histidine kinase PhoR
VLTAPRRITLYWLLLLVPTIAVGTVALVLLRREQARLVERGEYADQARQAAVAARARLIVENVELLIGDVETGLLDTLAGDFPSDVDAFLAQWEKTNPLVRTAFRATASGQILRPDANTATEDQRGFLRRFAEEFKRRPPWATSQVPAAPSAEKRELERASDESGARQGLDKNVVQVQSARRSVQELLKVQNSSAADVSAASPAASPALTDATSRATRAEQSRGSEADRARVRASGASAPSSGAVAAAGKATAPAGAARAKDAAPDRRGWLPVILDERLRLVGWIQPGGAGEVRGVELELAGLISRLAATLPAETGGGEGYALRDGRSRVLHQTGAIPKSGEPAVRVPLARDLLPGWDVVAYLLPLPESAVSGAGFFWPSALLVGVTVAAILAGGWLLRWQARQSEAEAAQKTSFVANVSHEFKTPLTTIRLYAELLEQGRVRDAAQGNDYLRTIGRETQRLARLVNNALDFSRLEQGRKKYACERINLTTELAQLAVTHSPRVAEAGLVLKSALPPDNVWVSADRDALEQIVLNLIDNACKYAADGGEIVIAALPQPQGGAEVRVGDRGPGVPPEHRERIFDKFHRVDDALTAEKTGAGLGLSIARQLARGQGGELRYAPRTGGGAEFILELPAARQDARG